MLRSLLLPLLVVAICLGTRSLTADDSAPDAAARNVLQTHCLACHSGQSPRGGLDLTSRENLLKGGDAGDVFDLKQPEKSRLLELINHTGEPGMPFKKAKLPADQIEILTKWVTAGVPYSAPLEVPRWWSLQPLNKPAVPAVPDAFRNWPLNPVDQFIAAAWPSRQLGPAAPADRRGSSAESTSISSACHQPPLRWMRSSPIRPREPMSESSNACCKARNMENAGLATGWTSPTSPRLTGTIRIDRDRTPGLIVTT